MESKVKLLGHPVHQMLVPIPFGLLSGAFIFDALGKVFGWRGVAAASFYMIAAGIVFGLLAAVFGLIDFLGIPSGTRAKRIGMIHGAGNVVVVVLFALSWFLRRDQPSNPSLIALTLSNAGFALAGVTGWLGGELVDRLSVGVDDGAHLDAPSSLTHSRAGAQR